MGFGEGFGGRPSGVAWRFSGRVRVAFHLRRAHAELLLQVVVVVNLVADNRHAVFCIAHRVLLVRVPDQIDERRRLGTHRRLSKLLQKAAVIVHCFCEALLRLEGLPLREHLPHKGLLPSHRRN